MKNIVVLIAVIITLGITSCGSKVDALSIDVKALDSACECGDAVLTVVTKMKVIIDVVGEEKLSDIQREELDKLIR